MMLKTIQQSFAYISVAVVSAVSDWITFTLIVLLAPTSALTAQAIARIVGGAVSFSINRHWSFREQQGCGFSTETRRFLVLYAFSYVLSLLTLYLCIRVAALNTFGSKLFADGLCFVVNFLVMKTYVFSRVDSALALLTFGRPPSGH